MFYFQLSSDEIVWEVGEKENSSSRTELEIMYKKILLVTRSRKGLFSPKAVEWYQDSKTTHDTYMTITNYFSILRVAFLCAPAEKDESEVWTPPQTRNWNVLPQTWIMSTVLVPFLVIILLFNGNLKAVIKDNFQGGLSDTRWDCFRAECFPERSFQPSRRTASSSVSSTGSGRKGCFLAQGD